MNQVKPHFEQSMRQYEMLDSEELDYIAVYIESTIPGHRSQKAKEATALISAAYADAAAIMRGEGL